MSPQLNFFGISTPGASIETVQKGRRRVGACALALPRVQAVMDAAHRLQPWTQLWAPFRPQAGRQRRSVAVTMRTAFAQPPQQQTPHHELTPPPTSPAAAYFCALCIGLMVASASYEEWVYGGVEISSNQALPPRVTLSDDFTWVERSVDAPPAHARQLQASPTPFPTPLPGARWFTLGLTRAYFEQPYTYANSGEAGTQVREYDVQAFIRDINAGSQNVNSIFFGLKIIPTSIFPATQGLLAFAAFLQVVLWILLMLLSYDLPSLVNFKWSPLIIRLLAVSTAFFTFVAVLVFMTSNLKTEFCSIFDPDSAF